jgi:hypothetical protein
MSSIQAALNIGNCMPSSSPLAAAVMTLAPKGR